MVHGTPYANSPAIDLEPPNKTTTKQATREENAGLVRQHRLMKLGITL